MEGNRLEPLFTLALATGLRRAELLGLRWSDVNLTDRVLFAWQTLQRTDQGLVFVPPKTHRSSRPLPLSTLAVDALKRQRVVQDRERVDAGELWSDHGLVFSSTIGTPLEPRNVNRRFEQLRARAGLEWLHLYDLRHAFATFLLDQGEELRTVMELLGHSTIRMTADVYGHVLPIPGRDPRCRWLTVCSVRERREGLAVRMAVPPASGEGVLPGGAEGT